MNRRTRTVVAATPRPQTSIREFTYSAGRIAESSTPPLAPPRGRASKGKLYVVIDADGSATGLSVEHLTEAFAGFFYGDSSRSITSTLQRAVQHLNEELAAENKRSVRKERTYASLACAVIRDEDAYIALAGPAIAFALTTDGYERLGQGDAKPGALPRTLLGQDDEVGVELFHRPISRLSSLLIGSAGLVDLGDGTLETALDGLSGSPVELIRQLGSRHRGRRRFSAAVVTFGFATEPALDVPAAPARRVVAPPTAPVPESDPGPSLRSRLFAIPPRRVAAPDGEETAIPERASRRRRRDSAQRPRVDGHSNGSNGRSIDPELVRDIPLANGTLDDLDVSHVVPKFERRRFDRGLGDRGTFGATNDKLDPPTDAPLVDGDESRTTGSIKTLRERAMSFRMPPGSTRAALIALAMVALFYVGYVVIQVPMRVIRESSDAASAIGKLSDAEQREQEALGQTDPLARRRLLDEASQLAAQAAAERPGSAAVATSTARIKSEYQTATAMTSLSAPTHIVDLPSTADQMVIANTELFVLDRADSRVYSYLLDVDGTSAHSSSNPILVRKGDHVGPATIGDLTQIAWIPAGDGRKTDNLVVLDTTGFLVQYDPTGGLSLLALRDPETWADPTILRGFGGDLYALNRKAQKLTVFPAQPTGYDGQTMSYFPATASVDLSDAATFLIDKDVVVVHTSGRVESYTDGKSNPVAALPADMTPRNPVGLAGTDSSIFVGDPARSRIIQTDRAGNFQRALSADDATPLSNLRDLAVSPDGKALFVLSGQSIYRFELPNQQS